MPSPLHCPSEMICFEMIIRGKVWLPSCSRIYAQEKTSVHFFLVRLGQGWHQLVFLMRSASSDICHLFIQQILIWSLLGAETSREVSTNKTNKVFAHMRSHFGEEDTLSNEYDEQGDYSLWQLTGKKEWEFVFHERWGLQCKDHPFSHTPSPPHTNSPACPPNPWHEPLTF